MERTDVIKYLGVYMDEQFSMKKHITEMCRKAMHGLYRLKQARKVLTPEAAETVAVGVVMSHLDYSNAILMGLPKHETSRLQRIQVLAARVLLGKTAHESSTRCLKELHWLPINLRIEYKILTLVFSKSVRTLRSNNKYMTLNLPNVNPESFANRSFSEVVRPRLWNELSNEIKQCAGIEKFKKKLKTFHFSKF